jgi:hypothetical protein
MVAVFEFLIKHRNTPITEDMIESTLASLRLPDLSSAAFYIKTIRRRVEGDEEGSLIEDTIFQGKKAYMLKAKRVSRVLVDDDISEIKPAS